MSVYDQEIAYNGKTQTIAEWAEDLGLTPNGLYKRLKYSSWDYGKALAVPNIRNKTYYGKTLNSWVKETGIDRHTLWHRFNGKHKDNLTAILETPVPRPYRNYPPLIYGYHRERLYHKRKRCCHPDCFHCPYKDCVMP